MKGHRSLALILAAAIGMDSGALKMLFTYHDAQTGAASGFPCVL